MERSYISSNGNVEIFAHMLIEDFLMRKNIFPETLHAFRREWQRPEQVSYDILLI